MLYVPFLSYNPQELQRNQSTASLHGIFYLLCHMHSPGQLKNQFFSLPQNECRLISSGVVVPTFYTAGSDSVFAPVSFCRQMMVPGYYQALSRTTLTPARAHSLTLHAQILTCHLHSYARKTALRRHYGSFFVCKYSLRLNDIPSFVSVLFSIQTSTNRAKQFPFG